MNKEQIYDNEISPLMKQIIDICQGHGIAMFADFAIGHDGEGPEGQDCTNLRCTTILVDEHDNNDPKHRECMNVVRARPAGMMITTTHSDGSKTMTAVV